MQLSLSEHDEAYVKTDCSPYDGSGVKKVVETVDYSGNTTFESPDDYFLRQNHNDNVRNLEAIQAYRKRYTDQKRKALEEQNEFIMHDKIATEQAFKRAEPKTKLLEEAYMQTMGSYADYGQLQISGDGGSADGLPYATDYEKIVCGPPFGPPGGTPVNTGMGFLDFDKYLEEATKSTQEAVDKELNCRLFGKDCPKETKTTTAPKPATTTKPVTTVAGFGLTPMAIGGIALGGLALLLILGKAMRK